MTMQLTGTGSRRLAPITTRTFGRFRLERRIAYGGMAEILLGTELRTNKQVVLKRILPQFSSSPEFVQYFIHEGRLGQRLRHPNLVETYEAGKVGETCYIALEWLRGSTCIELLRAAARAGVELPLGAAVRIVADAARGLHYAHTAADATGEPLGVVHRDVTPHNLFVCRGGATKVLDFGIAKAASQLHHTQTGTIKGKFSYLAPEQIRGESIDRRVDVFALGIVLHELLTLKPLFRGDNDAETLQRILTLEVPHPERVRHTVPPGLGAVALRALQRDRDRRLPSAEALADSIEAVAEAECIDASPEVVAALLDELCPRPPDEEPAPSEAALDFGPEPPSVRSASKSRAPLQQQQQLQPLLLSDTVPNPPPPLLAAPIPLLIRSTSDDDDLEIEVTPAPPVTIGRESGATPSLELDRGRGGAAKLAVILGAAVVVLGLMLARSGCRTLAMGQLAEPEPPPAHLSQVAAVAPSTAAPAKIAKSTATATAANPPAAATRPEPAAAPAPRVQEALVHITADGAATFTVDGRAQHPAADGALHLPPGHHKVVVSSPLLGVPRSFDLDLKNGDHANRIVHSAHGRLRLAVTPWAEVQVDGHAVGTTPFAPLDLAEGTHQVSLKNGELGVNLHKKVVVLPQKEIVLRVDLFSR